MSDMKELLPSLEYPLGARPLIIAGLVAGGLLRLLLWTDTLSSNGKEWIYLFWLPLAISAILVWYTRHGPPVRRGIYMQEGAAANVLFLCGAFVAFPEHLLWLIVFAPLIALYGAVSAALFAAAAGTSLSAARLPLSGWYPMKAGALIGVALRLVYDASPGESWAPMNLSFIAFAPLAVGAVTAYIAERTQRRSLGYHFMAGMVANALFILGTMLIMVEGLICAVLIFPLFAVYGALGAVVMGALCRKTKWPQHGVYSFTMLPLLLGAFAPNEPGVIHVGNVERTIVIQAAPESIWAQLHNTRNIQPSEVERAWMYRIGVPLPQSGVTRTTSAGHERGITMGKSIHFTQVASEWEENRRVRWTYRFDPDSFPPHAFDDHVKIGGHYFDLLDTVYTLTPRGDGRTELKVSMQFRVSTQFNWYTRRVAQLLIGNLENVFLDYFYARRAEASLRNT